MDGSPAYVLLWISSFLTIASFIKLSRIYSPGSGKQNLVEISDTVLVREYLPGKLQHFVVMILALLCIGSGVFGIQVAEFLNTMLYSADLSSHPSLFSGKKLLSVLPAILLGFTVFRLVITQKGKYLASRLKSLAPDLHTVLIFFFIGLLVFASVAYF